MNELPNGFRLPEEIRDVRTPKSLTLANFGVVASTLCLRTNLLNLVNPELNNKAKAISGLMVGCGLIGYAASAAIFRDIAKIAKLDS